ncbi:MAG: cation:proton antiporter, partial [Planctomycetota bacterium]
MTMPTAASLAADLAVPGHLTLAAGDASHAMLITAVVAVSGGTFLLIAARLLHLPAIVLLLLGGVMFGPELLNVVQPATLGDGLLVVVELAIGLILFEGGLTLRREGYRSAPAMIKRLLTLGVLVTWFATAIAVRWLVPLPWEQAVIAASLVIVTGPTVIAPLLKRLRVTQRLHDILHWEAVLIDPIGVFVAVLCFEWIGEKSGPMALLNLGYRAGTGLVIGIAGGLLILVAVRRRIVPSNHVNIFALASAVLVFGLAEMVIAKAGLLAVTVAGFCFGLAAPGRLKELRRFKAELTDLLIATLFVLLAARLELDQFSEFGLRGLAAVLAVMFVVRPLCILACSWRLGLSPGEKAFLSWVAPRGIVAASMASLFAISLEQRNVEGARLVETFTYSVIIGTIIVQGLTAGPVARLLGVRRPEPTGWLMVGAHALSERLAAFVRDVAGRTAVLLDTNARAV